MDKCIFLKIIILLIIRRAYYCEHIALSAHYRGIHTIESDMSGILLLNIILLVLIHYLGIGSTVDTISKKMPFEHHRCRGHKKVSVRRIQGNIRIGIRAHLLHKPSELREIQILRTRDIACSGFHERRYGHDLVRNHRVHVCIVPGEYKVHAHGSHGYKSKKQRYQKKFQNSCPEEIPSIIAFFVPAHP